MPIVDSRQASPACSSLGRPPAAEPRWRRPSLLILGVLVGAAVVIAYRYGGQLAALLLLVGIAVLAWWLDTETNLTAYFALLSIQLPVATFAFRAAVSDLFMLPVVARWVLGRRPLPNTTLIGPFLALVGVLAIGTLVAFVRTGHLGIYVLFNKDAGMVFLVLSSLAIVSHLRTLEDVRRAIDVFHLTRDGQKLSVSQQREMIDNLQRVLEGRS